MVPTLPARTFKTAWFAKAASKAKITNAALCRAIREVMMGQADDLGGGVFKKRLNDNRHRSIILAEGGQHWVYAYLFAKSDQANISPDELHEFRKLAGAYARMTATELDTATRNKDLLEICHDQ